MHGHITSQADWISALEGDWLAQKERFLADLESTQLGKTIEIINHEFESTVRSIRNNLLRMKGWADSNSDFRRHARMDINSELEPLTVYNYEVSSAMDTLVRYILKCIPDSYTEEFPSFSVFEIHSPWGAHVEREDIEEEGKIFCDPSLVNMDKDVAIGTLAHEFAHLFLGHTGTGGLQDEYQADELACRWGFVDEVRAMRWYFPVSS